MASVRRCLLMERATAGPFRSDEWSKSWDDHAAAVMPDVSLHE